MPDAIDSELAYTCQINLAVVQNEKVQTLLSDNSQIQKTLVTAARRLRVAWASEIAVRLALIAHVVLIPLLLVRQLISLTLAGYFVILVVVVAVGASVGWLLRLSMLEVARLLDARLGLKERLQTALEIRGHETGPVAVALYADASAVAGRINVEDAVPLKMPQHAPYLALVFLVAGILMFLPPVTVRGLVAGEEPTTETPVSYGVPAEEPTITGIIEHSGPPASLSPRNEVEVAFRDSSFLTKPPDFNSFLTQGDDDLSLLGRDIALSEPMHDHKPYKVSPQLLQTGPKESTTRQDSGKQAAEGNKEVETLLGLSAPEKDTGDLSQAPGDRQEMNSLDTTMGNSAGAGDAQHNSPEIPAGPDTSTPDSLPKQLTGIANDEHGLPKASIITSEVRPQSSASQAPKSTDHDETENKTTRFGGGQRKQKAPTLGEIPPWLDGPEDLGFQETGTGQGESKGNTSGQPGTGHAKRIKGDETPRLIEKRVDDLRLSGRSKDGDKPSYDTNLPGFGLRVASRVPYQELHVKYRRLAEEVLLKERVPANLRDYVKRYFSAFDRQ